MLNFLRTRIGVALALAIAIIGISIALKYKSGTSARSTALSPEIEKVVTDSLERDDDGDKLKNWEESLYKTDPKNPDTDGDGVSDGDEVALGRDPLVPGKGNGAEVASSTDFAYTATDRFSQELFAEYIKARQSGLEITPDISDRIAEQVLSQDYSDSAPTYAARDIKPLNGPSLIALKSYGNSLGAVLSTPSAGKETELDIFQKITKEPVEKYRTELTAMKARYEGMRAKILALPAPSELRGAQADIANALTLFIDAIDGALTMDEDPIGALGKISRYDGAMQLANQSLTTFQSYFAARKIAFSSTEPGYIFMR